MDVTSSKRKPVGKEGMDFDDWHVDFTDDTEVPWEELTFDEKVSIIEYFRLLYLCVRHLRCSLCVRLCDQSKSP